MAFPVRTISVFFLLAIRLPFLDGRNGVAVEINKDTRLEGQHQTNVQRTQGIKHARENETNAQSTHEMRRNNQLLIAMAVKHQLLSEVHAGQKDPFTDQYLTSIEKHKKITRTGQFDTNVPKIREINLSDLTKFQINENQRIPFEEAVPLLWKRASSAEQADMDKRQPKSTEAHHKSNPTSKLKEMLQPVSDAFSKAKHKIMDPHHTSTAVKKTRNSLSVGTGRTVSFKAIPSDRLVSGYTRKPSGLGHIQTGERPAKNHPGVHFSDLLPFECNPELKRSDSQWPQQISDVNSETDRPESPPPSPMKTPEVNAMTHYIVCRSKKWKEESSMSDSSSPEQKNVLPPVETETTKLSGSPSLSQTKSDPNKDATRDDPPSIRMALSLTHSASPRSHSIEVPEPSSEETKELWNFINRHRNGWSTTLGTTEARDIPQSPSNRPPSPTKPQLPTRSSPQSPSPPHTKPQTPKVTFLNSEHGLTNEQINEQYSDLITRRRSRGSREPKD